MKHKFTYFIGVDISKNTLDFCVLSDEGQLFEGQIKNSEKAINSFLNKLTKTFKVDTSQAVFCMEHTGCYGNIIVDVLIKKELSLWLESASQIKKSIGLVRGKSDKLDSKRIADYAQIHIRNMRPYKPAREVIIQLKVLMAERDRLINCKKQLSVAVKEQSAFIAKSIMKSTESRTKKIIAPLDKQIKAIEKEMLALIKGDHELNHIYQITTSVPGVGVITGIEFIISTEEFKKITEAKKCACNFGVSPFEHSSGTSIRGKSKVSHMANKRAKTRLHMAALRAIQMPGELKDYFDRKVSEGKNKMSVINAVRNKIIARVFACIKQNKMFEKEYQNDLVVS